MLTLYVCPPGRSCLPPFVAKSVHDGEASVWKALKQVPTHYNDKDALIYTWVIEVRDSRGIIQPQFNVPA